MVLNVKKSNFIIYLICLLIGIVLIIGGIILFNCNKDLIWDELFLSIGCSTIPTVITAYLIDQASEKRNKLKILELRNHFLWGMPHGLLWIMKTIIESYPCGITNESFYNCFKSSILVMENKHFSDEDFQIEIEERKRLLNESNLGYGIGLCLRDCKAIIDHDYSLEMNGIFSKDELLTISFLYEECVRIQKLYRICEMAEYLKCLVDAVLERIPEINIKASRVAIIKDNRIDNWIEISK